MRTFLTVLAIISFTTALVFSFFAVYLHIGKSTREATNNSQYHPPLQIVSLPVNYMEFDLNKVKGKLFGVENGNIFYIHKSLVKGKKEKLFVQVYEDNRANKIFTEVPEKWDYDNDKLYIYTPAHYVDENGVRISEISEDRSIFYESGMADLVQTVKIDDYYVAKTENTFQKPIFTFSQPELYNHYPTRSPHNKRDKFKDSIIYNQYKGMLFTIVN